MISNNMKQNNLAAAGTSMGSDSTYANTYGRGSLDKEKIKSAV